MSWLWEFFVSPSHPSITRGEESKALSDLPRDFGCSVDAAGGAVDFCRGSWYDCSDKKLMWINNTFSEMNRKNRLV